MIDAVKQLDTGFHRGMSFEEYLALPLVNSSAIKEGLNSMRRMKAAIDGTLPDKQSTALRFGSGHHCWILEGEEEFKRRFVVAEPCCGLLKSGEREGQECGKNSTIEFEGKWYCKTHGPKGVEPPADYVTADEYEHIKASCDSVRSHPAMSLLRRSGWSEVTGIAEVEGVKVKMRIDRFGEASEQHPIPLIIDLKKVQSGKCDDDSCYRSIKEYRYDIQAALYMQGAAKIVGQYVDFAWVFAEDAPPYDVNVIPIDPATESIGAYDVRRILRKWKIAERFQEYPGVMEAKMRMNPNDPPRGGLPDYYKRQREPELESQT